MKTLMFYSFKGGAGRTVAAANVAAALAKLGKRTVIVDLDFDAPGLHHVFGVENSPVYTSGLGIQSYLKGDIDLEQLMDETTIDLLASLGPLDRPSVPKGAGLLFIVAVPGVTMVDAGDVALTIRMQNLRDMLEKDGTEVLLIDASSGLGGSYAVAHDACDEMVIFFRWSNQHVGGTLKMADYLKGLRRVNRSRLFRVVASAAPDRRDLANTGSCLHDELARMREAMQVQINLKLNECNVTPPEVFFEIPELLEMKWREGVIVFRDDNSPFEGLDRKLMNTGI